MKSVCRRDFIRTLATVMAAGLGGAVTQSCTSLRAGYLAGKNGSYTSARALATLARNCRAVRKSGALKEIAVLYRNKGCTTEVIQDTFETLLVSGMFGDLSKADRMEPAVQKRVWDAFPVMTDAFIGMTTYLEQLGVDEREAARRMIIDEPEIMAEFQVQFDLAARELGVPLERMNHLHSLFNQCCWRLKNQDPSTVIDECIALVDKGGVRYGMTPELRRHLAMSGGTRNRAGKEELDNSGYQQWALLETEGDSTVATDALPAPMPDIRPHDNGGAVADTGVAVSGNDTTASDWEKNALLYEKGKKSTGLGGSLMGFGAVAEAAGWIGGLSSTGDAATVSIAILACVGGAVCFIIGLIYLISGLRKISRAKAEKRRMQNEQK